MIKILTGKKDGTKQLILGLSRENTNLLHEGKPIPVDLDFFGVPGMQIVLTAGETELDIFQQLKPYLSEELYQKAYDFYQKDAGDRP